MMPALFDPIDLAGVTLRNRVVMSPMCQYRAAGDGVATAWHEMHYRSRASGGVGLILTEMTDIEPRGRITEGCLGLWNGQQAAAFARLADAVHAEGARFGVQIAHAGRKSMLEGEIVAPSAVPFSPEHRTPRALERPEILELISLFGESAALAVSAGADVIELHAAHGYLIHQFMSPMSNRRDDEYGDPARFAVDALMAVKARVPAEVPVIVRLSAVEYGEGAYGLELALDVARKLTAAGADAFDVSTGGNGPVRPPAYPGYQLRYATAIKEATDVPVMAVGSLHYPALAEYAVREGLTDMVAIGKALLRNPHWAYEASRELGQELELPGEYAKGALV